MRIRSIKPEWLDDEGLHEAGLVARLMSICLITLADDYGNGRAHEGQLAGRLFWNEDDGLAKVREGLASLTRIGFLRLYEVRGQSYFHVVNWSKHQRVDKPGKPRVPGPEEASAPPDPAPDDNGKDAIRETSGKVRETLATDLDRDLDRDLDQEVDAHAREATAPANVAPIQDPWEPPGHHSGVWRIFEAACRESGLGWPGMAGGLRDGDCKRILGELGPEGVVADMRAFARAMKRSRKKPSRPWLRYTDQVGRWANATTGPRGVAAAEPIEAFHDDDLDKIDWGQEAANG